MIDEKKFKEEFGTRTPFTVPEGYFEKLQGDIMAKLPEEQPAKIVAVKSRGYVLRPLIGIAASVCVLIGGYAAYMHFSETDKPMVVAQEKTLTDESYDNYEAEDYIMMDNEAMYSYLMEQK